MLCERDGGVCTGLGRRGRKAVGERRLLREVGGGIAFVGGRDHPSTWVLETGTAGVEKKADFVSQTGPEAGDTVSIQRL